MELQSVLSTVVNNKTHVKISNFASKNEDEFIEYKYLY